MRDNIVDAGTHRKTPCKAALDGSEFLSKANYGRVPTYLHARNLELAAQYAKQRVRGLLTRSPGHTWGGMFAAPTDWN